MPIQPLTITASSLVNALGRGRAEVGANLAQGQSGLRPGTFAGLDFATWAGEVAAAETYALEPELKAYNCRNNRLAKLALDSDGFREAVAVARQRYGAGRIGVFMGTSTSGIAETEMAYRHLDAQHNRLPADFDMLHTHNVASVHAYTQASLQLRGVGLTISTACSSSAKVFAAAHRHIMAGYCDAAVVGGVDSLCLTTLYGFHALQLVAEEPCRPWDRDRQGINIGEAAGYALLEKSSTVCEGCRLLGYGESSDAYHMSTPQPQGDGAVLAMEQALTRAGLAAADIGYINLHGTATPSNDSAEDAAVSRVFKQPVACSSTKGFTGHTLGAAGITEILFVCLALETGLLPANINFRARDPALKTQILTENLTRRIDYAMSNSFGFGGTNCSVILGR